MTTNATIAELAKLAVDTPDQLSHADIVRLGAWHLDHDEHIAAFQRDTARTATRPTTDPIPRAPGSASLVERIAPQQPEHGTASMLPLPGAEKTADPAANDEHHA